MSKQIQPRTTRDAFGQPVLLPGQYDQPSQPGEPLLFLDEMSRGWDPDAFTDLVRKVSRSGRVEQSARIHGPSLADVVDQEIQQNQEDPR